MISIFSIYNMNYTRNLRVLDFFLKIHVTFLFSLFPFYLTDNTVLQTTMNSRSIENRGITINELKASLEQVK